MRIKLSDRRAALASEYLALLSHPTRRDCRPRSDALTARQEKRLMSKVLGRVPAVFRLEKKALASKVLKLTKHRQAAALVPQSSCPLSAAAGHASPTFRTAGPARTAADAITAGSGSPIGATVQRISARGWRC
jgi:hypothetical protein